MMKRWIILLLSVALLYLNSCTHDSEKLLYATGKVWASGGLYDCPYQIILEDNSRLYPVNEEMLIPYKMDQRIEFIYQFANDSVCDGAKSILLYDVEAIDCTPYIDLNFNNDDSLRNDPLEVLDSYIENDCLVLEVSYGGCTDQHDIDLARINPWCGTPPLPPPYFELKHDAKNEDCYKLVLQTLSFDLHPLRTQGDDTVDFMVSYAQNDSTRKQINFTYVY